MRYDLKRMARKAGIRRAEVALAPITPRKSLEAGLYRAFLSVLKEGEKLKPELISGAIELKSDLRVDGPKWDFVKRKLRAVFDYFLGRAEDMIDRHLGMEAARHTEKWVQAVNQAIGVDLASVVAASDVRTPVDIATQRNVALIKGLTDEVAKRVEATILDMVTHGKANAAIADELGKVFGFGRKRAALIARDQAAKFNGNLNRIRQMQAGITEYVWKTSLDERVRGNPSGKYPSAKPSHWDREGKRFKWSDAPSDGHPGEPINCRCTARPVFKV